MRYFSNCLSQYLLLQSILGIQPHMSTYRGCFGLSVSGMVSILKAEKEGARVCTVIVRVGRVWNTLWYLCLRCLYIRNRGGLDFSGRAFNRPISYIPKVVWTCLPSALPFTIDQILSTQSGKRNWVEALGQSSSKSPQELSGHRKVYTGGAQRVEIWGCWLVLCQPNMSSSERREPQLRKCLQAE